MSVVWQYAMAASFNQAREYERAPVRERGVMVVHGISYPGVVGRIGGGGIFFETNQPLEKGQAVLLRFRVACFDDPLLVKGEVRWVAVANGSHPHGLGIAFLDLDPARRQAIVEFVAERGSVLCVVNSLLHDGETDLERMQKLLDKVDMGSVHSIDELRARVKAGMEGFFERGH